MGSADIVHTRLVYRIDADGRIREFDHQPVGGSEPPASDAAVGRSLWDFVRDATVVDIYQRMIRIALGGKPIRFRYRCDAPEWRRLYEMAITRTDSGLVQFATHLVREEPRPPVLLLDRRHGPRSEQMVRLCSWCERAHTADEQWVPIEEAVEILGVMQKEAMPEITHGICPRCAARVRRQLERDRAQAREDLERGRQT